MCKNSSKDKKFHVPLNSAIIKLRYYELSNFQRIYCLHLTSTFSTADTNADNFEFLSCVIYYLYTQNIQEEHEMTKTNFNFIAF